MAFGYTCSLKTDGDSQSPCKFLRWMSALFSFLLLCFTTYASCFLMCYTCCYVHELYISLCLLFRIIPSMWVIVPAKTLVINRDFWYAHSSKRWPEWQNGIGLTVKNLLVVLAHILCFLIISWCFCYPHSLNLDICCLLCFPYIGLSLLTIFMLCFNSFPPNCIKWCTRCSDKPTP